MKFLAKLLGFIFMLMGIALSCAVLMDQSVIPKREYISVDPENDD